MDIKNKIIMRLLEDAISSENNTLNSEYDRYYESLTVDQSRIVVSDALRQLIRESNGKAKCQFNKDTFTL